MRHNPERDGMISRKAFEGRNLRATKVRHKEVQVSTRFFRRGYHWGYHRIKAETDSISFTQAAVATSCA